MASPNATAQAACATCGGTGTVTVTICTPSGQPQTLTETCLDCQAR